MLSGKPIGTANANMAQLVEHILGKDEVPSSNLGISLKTRRLTPKVRRPFHFHSDLRIDYLFGFPKISAKNLKKVLKTS